jgi:hypothetical protein
MANYLDHTYLFSGIPLDDTCKDFIKESLVPVTNMALFVTFPGDKTVPVWSDYLGRLVTVKNGKDAANGDEMLDSSATLCSYPNQKAEFYAAPDTLLFDAVAAKGNKWVEYIKEVSEKQETKTSKVELTVKKISIDYLRPPVTSSSDQSIEDYRGFYEGLKTNPSKTLNAYVIPRAQILLGFISKMVPNNDSEISIKLKLKNLKTPIIIKDLYDNKFVYCHKITEADSVLNTSPCQVEVPISNLVANSDIWRKQSIDNGVFKATCLCQMNVVTPSLEIGTIDISPVSLESALVLQYANKYDGLLETIATKTTEDIKKDDYLKLFQSIKGSAEWTKEKYELSQGMINTEDKKELIKTYYDFITKASEQTKPPEWLSTMVSLTFDGMGSYEKYKKFKETYKIAGELKDNLKIIAKYDSYKSDISGFSAWIRKHNIQNNLIKEALEKMESTPACLSKLTKSADALIDLQEFKGAKAIHRLLKNQPKVLKFGTIVSLAFDSATIISAAGDFSNASKNVAVRRTEFERLLKEYIKEYGNGGSQNAIVILETYRKAVNLARAGKTKEFFELVEATVNLALSLVALFPPTALAGELILLAKTLVELVRDASTAFVKALDYSVFKNYLLLKQTKLQEFFDTHYDSHFNSSEMSEVFKDKLVNEAHIQFRLRAEAIAGLYELIQWAGYRYDETKIVEFVEQYKIKEYIETFILCKNSPWVYPKSRTFPLTLCDYWLFRHSTRAKIAAVAGAVAVTSLSPALAGIAMAMGISSIIDDSVFTADFQKLFPIHFVENGITKEKLAKLFQTHSLNYSNLPCDIVDKILVYYRYKKEDKWIPVWSYDENAKRVQIKSVNPLTQIRVCVILKDDSYIFKSVNTDKKKITNQSIPLELNLLDDKPLKNEQGPVYKKNSYVLTKDEANGLLDSDFEKDYFDKKRHGAVFYPFYEYDGGQVNGLKPFTPSPSYLEFNETHNVILCLQIPRSRVKQYFVAPEKNGIKSPDRLEIPMKYEVNVSGNNDKKQADFQWKMAQDKGFLKHTEATGAPVPPLTRLKTKIPGVFLKRNGVFTYCKDDKKKILSPGVDYDFNWNSPFEMVVLLALEAGVDGVCSKSNAIDFRRYPLSITFSQEVSSTRDSLLNPFDIQGPSFNSYFHYLGSVNLLTEGTSLPYGLHNSLEPDVMAQYEKIDSKEVRDVVTFLQSVTKKGKGEVDKILSRYSGSGGFAPGLHSTYALYAAHFRFSYDVELPDHQKKTYNAFRPFGKVFEHEQYYYFKIVQAGVNVTSNTILKTPDLLKESLPGHIMSKLKDETFMIKEAQGQNIPSLRSAMLSSS